MFNLLFCVMFTAAACATDPTRPAQWVGDEHRHEYLSLMIEDATVLCIPYDPEGPLKAWDGTAPEDIRDAESVLCEQVQTRDYAPCRVKRAPPLEDSDEDRIEIWCAYPPGAMWRVPPGVELTPPAPSDEGSI